MAWIYLIFAGIFEVVWAVGLKYCDGFTRFWPSVITILGMAISFYLLAASLKTLPMGTAYTVWTAIGAIGTVITGIFLFNEPVNLLRITCIMLILLAVIGLKFSAHT